MKSTGTSGTNAVDWEERVDFDRLRDQRLARLKGQLETSELGAVLAFDFSNIRYMSSTHIGTWAMDKLIRFALLTRNTDPIVWDFGSAAKHHALYNPWLDVTSSEMDANPHAPHEGAMRPRLESGARAGISTLRGAFPPDAEMATDLAKKIKRELEKFGVANEPLGVDVIELPVLFALQKEGIDVVDGQQVFMNARRIKTTDEIRLLTQAASMVDAAYEDLYRFLRPGVRENEAVGLVAKTLYDLGSEYVEGVNAISGERCAPHPHVFSDRLIRPGDPAFFDILHSWNGYRTCYYRTFAVGSASSKQRDAYTRPGSTSTAPSRPSNPAPPPQTSCSCGPRLTSSGSRTRWMPSPSSTDTVWALHLGEADLLQAHLLDHPEPLEEGMVFALETYWPSADGWGAARIEEEVVVTADGCEVITKFPAEELIVAGRQYYTVDGPLNLNRDSQSHLNTPAGRGEE